MIINVPERMWFFLAHFCVSKRTVPFDDLLTHLSVHALVKGTKQVYIKCVRNLQIITLSEISLRMIQARYVIS